MTDFCELQNGIENANAVIEVFGAWPEFHDAELHSLVISREAAAAPCIDARIHVFGRTSDIDSSGHYAMVIHRFVTLQFFRVASLELSGFNEQNALFALTISQGDAIASEPRRSGGYAWTEPHYQWNPMKCLCTIFLLVGFSACFKGENRVLSGPTLLDSSGAILKSNGSLRNVDVARLVVVVERHQQPDLQGAEPDSCGSPSIRLIAHVEMSDGRRIDLSGNGPSPCNAGTSPITDTIDLRDRGSETLPRDKIRSIQLQSNKLVTLRSIEWQTWEQGP